MLFVQKNRERFPKPLRGFAAITTLQFTIGVTILFALILLALFLATRPQRDMTLFTICLAIFLLHVITHVAYHSSSAAILLGWLQRC